MKNFIGLITVIVIFFYQNITAQEKDSLLNALYNKFESFEYDQVINISENLLEKKSLFDQNEVIEIYRIRATAQFSVDNEDSAKSSLREIIALDESYTLDPAKNSPKMINLYEELRYTYFLERQNQAVQDSMRTAENIKEPEVFYSKSDLIEANTLYRNSIIRSLFLPGWGHLYSGKSSWKGITLTASSIATLSGMIYYIIDSNKKEKTYLQESNKALINDKYDSFNKSYKLRNLLITAFSALWLYTQIDLLYISSDNFKVNTSVMPDITGQQDYQLSLVFIF